MKRLLIRGHGAVRYGVVVALLGLVSVFTVSPPPSGAAPEHGHLSAGSRASHVVHSNDVRITGNTVVNQKHPELLPSGRVVSSTSLSRGTTTVGSAKSSTPASGTKTPTRPTPPDLSLAKGVSPRWLLNQPSQKWMLSSGRPTPAQIQSSLHPPKKAKKPQKSQTAAPSPSAAFAPQITPDTPGSISGTVVDSSTAAPIASVTVTAYSTSLYSATPPTTTTAANGTYTLSGLAPGSYDVSFADYAQSHLVQWYPQQPSQGSATPVTVSSGGTTSGINGDLIAGGGISGTITSSSTNQPLADVCVSAFTSDGTLAGGGCSNSAGKYQTTGLQNGKYELEFTDDNDVYLSAWDGGTSLTTATPVKVKVGTITTGTNIALAPGGSLKGTVTSSSTQAGIGGICAYAFSASFESATQCSNSSGAFDITGLPTGSYQIEYYDQNDQYVSAESSTAYAVTAGAVTSGVTQSLGLGGSISGLITDATNGHPTDGSVCASGESSCESSTNGQYTIGGLASGSYYVEYSDPNDLYESTYAGPFTVTAPNTTTNANIQVDLGGSITGTIVNAATNAPLADVCATIYYYYYYSSSGACTNGAGTYTLSGLGSGSYTVDFYDPNNVYAASSYSQSVSVTQGATTPNINGALSVGGSITGTVTSSGTPVAGICLGLESLNALVVNDDYTCSEVNGTYQLSGLGAGQYDLEFYDPNDLYVTQYYNNQPSESSATAITVTQGATTANVNASMVLGGVISGKVVGSDTNQALADVCTYAELGGTYVGTNPWSCSDSTGFYELTGLPTGTASVTFDPTTETNYLTATDASVGVTAGQTTTLNQTCQWVVRSREP